MDLDLTPQGGDSFILGAPGYVLHLYEKGSLTSHFGTVPGDWGYSGPYSFSKENSLKMEA
jgi:hypothetical protein